MDDLQHAVDLVRKSESGIRALMERALAEQRYGDLADVAPFAEALATLLRDQGTSAASIPARNGVHSPAFAGQRQVAKPRRDDYPRFERDGDKLVKIAWSKKDRREYEHRAPHAAVIQVAKGLTAKVRPGAVFKMDKLLPFKDQSGEDMPSYQAYVTLAWFRQLGAVQERGKDGYTLAADALEPTRIEQDWKALTTRK